jgi:hypothetical protein
MKTVQPKMVIFYGGTLAFVVALFHTVTRYGDTQLLASPNVDGRYLSSEAMPGCPEASRILLTILQSGVYLNGSVNMVENPAVIDEVTSERTPPLSGRLMQQRVMMDGTATELCQSEIGRMQVDGTIITEADKKLAFDGKILSGAQSWQMKGIRLVESKKKEGH